eukprot:TRINITY_DN26742_c0_g1_i3.p1 TRINITY_DN26742_c0_g1~~TRINITY_DN26742_c0_g1_i3.p1  ORF type:complete len:319 (-),score=15.91 TRINITY_DN26742_c0_g1_i3:201-1157(-)
MSFQDFGRGPGRGGSGAVQSVGMANGHINGTSASSASSKAVASGVFQMNTAVSTFKRLVNSLGTPKDTVELREKLHKSRQYISHLAKDTAQKLKDASARDHSADVAATQKIADAKLAKDFQAVLREFERAQHQAADREAAFAPYESPRRANAASHGGAAPSVASSGSSGSSSRVKRPSGPSGLSATGGAHLMDGREREEQQMRDPLMDRQRNELAMVENELAYNEAVIEERDQGIQEIQQQIVEVNEIFQDLAVLVREQGVVIDDIEANIESSRAQTVQANKQLTTAAKSQRESNSFTCWVMAVFAIGLFIFFLIMSS